MVDELAQMRGQRAADVRGERSIDEEVDQPAQHVDGALGRAGCVGTAEPQKVSAERFERVQR